MVEDLEAAGVAEAAVLAAAVAAATAAAAFDAAEDVVAGPALNAGAEVVVTGTVVDVAAGVVAGVVPTGVSFFPQAESAAAAIAARTSVFAIDGCEKFFMMDSSWFRLVDEEKIETPFRQPDETACRATPAYWHESRPGFAR